MCADLNTTIDTKALAKHLKASNLRAADEESLKNLLNGEKGKVNYFSIINDKEKKVKLILDKVLFDAEWASFHPMDNTASTCINQAGILKIKEMCGRDDTNWQVLDFAELNSNQEAKKDQQKPKGGAGNQQKLTDEQKKQKK